MTVLWGIEGTEPTLVEAGLNPLAGRALFAAADSGGAEVAVAYVKDGRVTVEFLDEQGLPSAARPRSVLTPTGMVVSEVAAAASGVVGFAVGWADAATGDPQDAILSVQYFGLSGAYGAPVTLGTGRDLQVAGYALLDAAGKKPVADGFAAAWIEDGAVKFQRYAVWLDLAKDPTGAVAAAGRDGVPGTPRPVDDPKSVDPADTDTGAATVFSAGGLAGDVAMTVTHDGETVLAWTETAGGVTAVRLMVMNQNGSANASVHGGGGLPVTVDATGIATASEVEVAWLAGGGFVVAWTQGTEVHARVYTATGGAPGTGASFAAGPEVTLIDAGAGFGGGFKLATMLEDLGGFTLSYTDGTTAKAMSFTAAGVAMDAAPLTLATVAPGSVVATASLANERVLVLSEAAGAVQGSILDPRGATGMALNGTDAPGKPIADILVGGIGADTIDGGAGDDILDGGLGDDRILAGAGNDLIDGGGGVDSVVFAGARAEYALTDLGGGLYRVVDGQGIDGDDLLRGVETLVFSDGSVDLSGEAGEGSYVTPTAWGLTDADADLRPAGERTPDTDGFVVNGDAAADRAGVQSAPVVSDNVGEFVAILWETATATGSRIQASFYNVLGEPDTETPLPDTMFLTDGLGVERKPVVAGGGGASGWGFVFSEVQAGGHEILKTNFLGIGLTGTEQAVDAETGMHFHDASVFGSFLDRRLVDGVVVDARPAAMNDGYNVAYVASAIAPDGSFDPVYGEVRLQRFEVPLSPAGEPGSPVAGGIDGMAGVRDGRVVDATEDAPYVLAAHGRSPSVTALHTFETVAVWIESVGGVERVAGAAIDDVGGIVPVDMSDISAGDRLADGAGVSVVSAGAVNAAVVWVALVDGQPVLRATMYSSPGAGLDGQGFDLLAPVAPFSLMDLPAGVDLSSIRVTGISGEDSNDIVVQWETGTGADRDIFARHFAVTLDPASGVALAMRPDGDAVQVHALTAGEQGQGSVAGLLGDRFISVWAEGNAAIAEGGSDIVARIFDTRAPGQEITGDLLAADGQPQARRDILVGTVGDDTIRGDISDADGLVDQLFGGMGDDVLIGGPGIKGAAGSPELIDGGSGRDTAVYSGNLSEYTITAIFDPAAGAGFEIRDNRAEQDANGDPAQHDGVDTLFGVEVLRFRDVTLDVAEDVYAPPAPAPLAGWDGTPSAWSLTDGGAAKTIDLGTPADEGGIVVTSLQDDAAMLWVADGHRIMAVRQDITGVADPLWALPGAAAGAIEMTDGRFAANSVAQAAVAMAGGLGLIGAWTSTDPEGGQAIHLRYGSTATDTPFDGGAAGYPAYGFAGGEIVVAGSEGGSGAAVKGYEIVDAANDTVEIGFHVAFVAGGEIRLARYEIPVYAVDPVSGARLGAATPAAFGTGAETEPRLLNADGTRAFDALGAQVDAGAGAVPSVGSGTRPTLATLHDGELVLGYLDADGRMAVQVIGVGTGAADRGGAAGATTVYDYAGAEAFAFGAGVGQGMVVAQQNGSFGVFWTEGTGTQVVKAVIFAGAVPSAEMVLGTLPEGAALQVAASGVDPITGAEDGFVWFWQDGSAIGGQRIDMQGAAVGAVFAVDAGGSHAAFSAAGIDNGLLIVGHEDGLGGIGLNYLDTRQPGIATLGPRTGAPRDVAVGTTGDDAMDGRASDDMLYAGLGNDVITLGLGNDRGEGGAGADTILGGDGQDVLEGGAGDDLLLPGQHGPATPALNRDLNDGLAANGVDAAVIASNAGADLVTGGEGVDTLSFRQDWAAVRVDLQAGLAFRRGSADAGLPQFTDGGTTAGWQLGAVIGVVTADRDPAVPATFAFSHDIENIEGGRGNDVLLGDGGANRITLGGGEDVVDGRGGVDTVVLQAAAADYFLSAQPDGSVTVLRFVPLSLSQPDGMEYQRISGVEFLQFADRLVRVIDIPAEMATGDTLPDAAADPLATADVAVVNEDGSVTIDVLANDLPGAGGGPLAVTAVEGQGLSIGASVAVAQGVVTRMADGTLRFAPGADFNGAVDFAYTVTDGAGRSAPGVVHVTVVPQADAPRPAADAFVATAGRTALLDVLANDINPDPPAPLLLQEVTVLDGAGTAEVVDNVISFSATVAGLVRLRYTVAQGAETASAEVTVEVGANLNAAPVLAGDFTAVMDEAGTYTLDSGDLAASDADGDPVTFHVSGLTDGTVFVNGVEGTAFTGADRVTFRHDGSETTSAGFDVVASDGGATSAARRFSVSVTPVNDAPVVTGAGAPVTYVENAVALLIVPDLTLTDPDGTTLSAARVEIAAPRPEDRIVVANWRPENGQSTTMGNITLTYSNGVLLLAGIASLAEYQGVLRLVGYANASDRPDTAARSITVTVDDGGSVHATAQVVASVEIVPTDDGAAGWVALIGAAGAGTAAELVAAAGLVDADLAGPVTPGFVWSASATLGGVATDIGSGASLTLPGGAAPAYVSVDAVYADGHGTHRVEGTGLALVGTVRADTLSTEGVDVVLGLGGNDRITYVATSQPGVVVDGGAGTDTLTLAGGVRAYGPVTDAELVRVEAVTVADAAGAAVDLSAQSEGFTVAGGAGADTVTGGQGADRVSGGAGNDLFLGFDGDGSDAWIGGAGTDTISFDGIGGAVSIDLSRGTARGTTIGTDTLTGIENATGGGAGDTILGNGSANRLEGGDGDDLLQGGGGADTVKGGGGNDRIFGDAGLDVLTGGEGEDSFCFSGPGGGMDIITDFQPGDSIEITASAFLRGLTNAQVSSGAWFFQGLAAHDLDDRLIYDRDSGYLIYDSNGNRNGGTIVQIARFDSDDDLSNGFGGCDINWMDFIVT